jgi:SAM-dependent methyltransferase
MNKISKWVKYCLELVPCKNSYVLDLACGKGRHSIYLSNLGYNVLSVDVDEDKLNYFNGKLIKKKVLDVENINNWPLEKKNFNAIIVTNFLNRKIFPKIISSIKKEGYLIYETFSEGHQKIGRPTNPQYILKPRELIQLTNKMQLIAYENIYINNPSNHLYQQRILAKNV